MMVTSTAALRSACAANRPPKPEPMMTTRGRPLEGSLVAGTCAGDVVMMIPSSHPVTPASCWTGAIHATVCPRARRPAARRGRLLAVGAAAHLRVPLADGGRRSRLELLQPGLVPLRRGVGA